MYYLFENNKIYNIENDDKENFSDEVFDKLVEQRHGKIKKKRENVFDLIDRDNDLLKISVLGFSNVLSAKSINGNFKDMDNILAIYKPNINGDYICVWRRENEEH